MTEELYWAVRNLWDESEIRLFDADRLVALNIDATTVEVLAKVGLPIEVSDGGVFETVDPKSTMTGAGQPLVQFGVGRESEMCIDCSNRQVVITADENGIDGGYVNKDIRTFLEYLIEWQKYANLVRYNPDELEPQVTMPDVHARLREIDPEAMGDHGWWSMIVEEMYMV